MHNIGIFVLGLCTQGIEYLGKPGKTTGNILMRRAPAARGNTVHNSIIYSLHVAGTLYNSSRHSLDQWPR